MTPANDYLTREAWYQATFGDCVLELNGAFSGSVALIPCDDGEIGLRLKDIADQDTIYMRPQEALELAHELIRLAGLV